jgi:hypothetical protein
MNEVSSRSHTVFTATVVQRNRQTDEATTGTRVTVKPVIVILCYKNKRALAIVKRVKTVLAAVCIRGYYITNITLHCVSMCMHVCCYRCATYGRSSW